MQGLYTENHNASIKSVSDLYKQELPSPVTDSVSLCQFSKPCHRVDTIPTKILGDFSIKTDMCMLRLVGNGKKQSKAILINLPDLRLVIKYNNQNNNKSRKRQKDWNEAFRNSPTYLSTTDAQRRAKAVEYRGWFFSIKVLKHTMTPQAIAHTTSIHLLKMITDLDVKPKTLKFLEDTKKKLSDFGLDKGFLWKKKHIQRNKTKDRLDYIS